MDRELALFLEDVTATLGLRALGFRRTWSTVRKRLSRRLRALGLSGLGEYRRYLSEHHDEWAWLEQCCRITISRFGRDAAVFAALTGTYLPERARAAQALGEPSVRVWSAGAASGEEPYSLAIAWQLEVQPRFPDLRLEVLATDADPTVLARAARARYSAGSLWELPAAMRERAFIQGPDEWTLRDPFRAAVRFERADLQREHPSGPFDIVLCRNLAFTYFGEPTQQRVARCFVDVLRPGGVLLVGHGETVPSGVDDLVPRGAGFYERARRVPLAVAEPAP